MGMVLFGLGAAGPSTLAQAPDARALLVQLKDVAIDPEQIYVLRDARLTRDRINIYFNRGFLGLFTKAGGEVTGAAFGGEGEILLMPPDTVEKRNLAQFSQSPILEEQFTSIYLRFTDGTAKELLAVARKPAPDDLEQPTHFVEEWDPVVRRLSPDDSGRLLQDLLGDRTFPYFHAQIQGATLGVFEVMDDERQLEAVGVGAIGRSQGKLWGDIWCSFPSRASQARSDSLIQGQARVFSYKIDTRINIDHSLEGHAVLELESHSNAERVLTFELSRRLKVSAVKDEAGRELVAFQNPSLEESEVAARGNDWIEVVLPSRSALGQKFRLDFTYQGNVITDVGNGVLYVGAHGSWYPNRGPGQRSNYDLSFQYPDQLTLVATGSRVEETIAAGWKRSRWVSDGAFPVAGFNLGVYESRVRRTRGASVEVYAASRAEAPLEKPRSEARPEVDLPPALVFGRLPTTVPRLEPSALLDNVAEIAADAVKYFETLFGPFPYPRLAISQIPGRFAQGWPELVYLPTLSFLPRPSVELAEGGKRNDWSNQVLISHEIAHQWWGNQLGWRTYRDQWLSEGFASYAAALYLARGNDGERKFNEMLRGYKRDLMGKTEGGKSVESGGPIWLGARLSNSRDPEGYVNIVYKKACWTLHMLRSLMRDPATGSDEKFFKMLRDLAATYRGANPSTEDFIRHAEKYMTPSADLTRDGKLDWFFTDWVYGTGIPTYKLQASVRRRPGGQYAVEGTIEQSDVPDDFEMLVPVVASLGKDRKKLLGQVAVTEARGRFRFVVASRPSHIAIDEDNLLAVVR